MMRTIATLLLLWSALGSAQSNTEQYPIKVHVSSSKWVVVPTVNGPVGVQKLAVLIDGKKYELEAELKGGWLVEILKNRVALLALGDYKAKLVDDVHKNNYESAQTYEFQFSDGKTRKFVVVGQTE